MQSHYPASFERDMACTAAEWLGWLPAAIGPHPWVLGRQEANANCPAGQLHLSSVELPPCRIALLKMA